VRVPRHARRLNDAVETGTRGGLLYTYDEMVSSGWTIGLTLGP
jgi:hypothetical protein